MKKTDNESFNRIIDFLSNVNVLDDEQERRFLIHYAALMKKNNIENVQKESIKNIIHDFKVLNDFIKYCNETLVVKSRIERMLYMIDNITDYYDSPSDDKIAQLSYELDKLYLENDLPLRKNSSLSYNLDKIISKNYKGR